MRRLCVVASLLVASCAANRDDASDRGSVDAGRTEDSATSGFDAVGPGDAAFADATCASSSAAAIKRPVDLIFAIDQSTSMVEEIANVRANINKLSVMLAKTGLNYRVVMIASPTGDVPVCVPPPLGGSSCGASNGTTFLHVHQEVQSFEPLKRIVNTYDAPPGPWSTILRTDAVKVFIPISDADSKISPFPEYTGITAEEFDKQILLKGKGQFGTAEKRNYLVYPIIGARAYPSEEKCATADNPPVEYIKLVKLTKTKWFSICDDADYGPLFTEMAKSIATRAACELIIPAPPSGETLDPNRVNVTYRSASGASETVPRDDSAPCESGANGWQYSADKTRVVLCGPGCARVQADLEAKVDVQFGCATIIR